MEPLQKETTAIFLILSILAYRAMNAEELPGIF